MGGGDKPLRLIAGRPMLAHVIARIEPQVAVLALNANGDPARFADWNLPVIPDAIEGKPGPLAGIHAGMVWAQSAAPGIVEMLSIPTDLPFLPENLAKRLQEARSAAGADIAVAASGGRSHHAVALWPIRLTEALHRAVTQEGLRKVAEFQGRYRVVAVDFPAGKIDPFTNINDRTDLERAQNWAERD
jgi:molybdopterin-guanine dinucleotide biosynthesis protein A